MAELNLAKAELRELEDGLLEEKPHGKSVVVQFNPESLKVSFANQVVKPDKPGDQNGPAPLQFVGAGSTKLSLQLWFDVTQVPEGANPGGEQNVDDVRKLTEQVAFFITPSNTSGTYIIPGTRFVWGSFLFDGVVESLEESLEFFSPEGRPLRASVTLSLTQQKITNFAFGKANKPGTKPLTQAPAGATLQGLADSQGKGDNWQSIADANAIENPRMLQPGQLLDMNLGGRPAA